MAADTVTQYDIRITKTGRVVLALIVAPLVIVMPITVGGALYGPSLPDWAVLAIVAAVLGVAIVATIAIVKKISPEGVVTVTNDGFRVTFPAGGLFAPAPFEVKINEIKNFFAEEKGGLYYMSFKTSGRHRAFNIEACSKDDQDLASFSALMEVITGMVAANNTVHQHDAKTIASVSMYERWWAKLLSVFVIAIFLLVIFMKIFMPGEQSPPWWRLLTVMIFGVPFIYKVYERNYMKKK